VIKPNYFFNGNEVFIKYEGWTNLAITIILLLCIYIFRKKTLLSVYPLVITLILTLYYFTTGWSEKNYQSDSLASMQVTNKNNVYLIVFDGMPTHITENILKNDKELSEFYLYKNSITKHPGTWGSLQEILGGPEDSVEKINARGGLNKDQIYKVSPEQTVKEFIKYGWSSSYSNVSVSTHGMGSPIPLTLTLNIISLLPDTIKVKFLKEEKLNKIQNDIIIYAERLIPKKINEKVLKPIDYEKKYQEKISNIQEKIIFSDDFKNTLNIMYFSIPHAPYFLSGDCQIKKTNEEAYLKQIEQNKCALQIIKNIVNKLKSYNIYDKTSILVTSDHGWYEEKGDLIKDINYYHGAFQSRFTNKQLFTTFLFKPNGNKIIDPNIPIYTQSALPFLCSTNQDCPEKFKTAIEIVENVFITEPFNLKNFTGKYKIINKMNVVWDDKKGVLNFEKINP
jgi:hypothetical protein